MVIHLCMTLRYCRCNDRCLELEKLHKEKVEIVRKSYRSQLNNAIQKIAGEYQVWSVCMFTTTTWTVVVDFLNT